MSKLKPYPKYKPIAYDYVSQLPEGWELLPNIAIFQERIERGFENEELLSVTIAKGVIKQGDIDTKKDSSNEDKSKYKLIKVGDIAYNRMRMWQGALGYSEYQGITSPAYVILKPKMEINPRFFFYMFRTEFYKNYVARFSYGIADGQIPLRYVDFKRMYSIVPPLAEQNAIVAYLDAKTQQIQDFITKKQKLIQLLEEKKKAVINILIFNNSKKEKEYKLKYLCSKLITGQWGDDEKGNKNDVVCIRVADFDGLNLIKEGHTKRNIQNYSSILLKKNDLLIEKSGGGEKTPVGRVVKFDLDVKAVTSNFISKFSTNENIVLVDYLLYTFSALNSAGYNLFSIKQTTGIQNLDISHYFSNKIPLPPKEEQEQIVKKIEENVERINQAITQAQKEIEKLQEYQESLISHLVTGQLQVPVA